MHKGLDEEVRVGQGAQEAGQLPQASPSPVQEAHEPGGPGEGRRQGLGDKGIGAAYVHKPSGSLGGEVLWTHGVYDTGAPLWYHKPVGVVRLYHKATTCTALARSFFRL